VGRALRLLLPVVALAGCAGLAPPGSWQSRHDRHHPLAGRIWAPAEGRFLEPAARLARVEFVLLGEKHDNPDHHRLQAWILSRLVAAGRRPAVGLEMLSVDQDAALARHLAARPHDAAGLGEAVDWHRAGWPPWDLYRPLAEVALGAGLPLVAADLGREHRGEVRRQGLSGLPGELRTRLGLETPLAPALRAALAREIADAHCGYLPPERVDVLVDVQRARDAHMAWRLATAGAAAGVLIAGAGHVRRDWGVPTFLARFLPGARVASVAFVEVRPGLHEPEPYAAGPEGPAFDYVWFTPRVDAEDPCARYRPALQRLRERAPP
jgi:uncharacterized iron-regulated protein